MTSVMVVGVMKAEAFAGSKSRWGGGQRLAGRYIILESVYLLYTTGPVVNQAF